MAKKLLTNTLTAEDWSIFLFYESTRNSFLLESSFVNPNFYEDYEFEWSCLPLDPSECPYCPSESTLSFFLFLDFFLISLSFFLFSIFKTKQEGLHFIPQDQTHQNKLFLIKILKQVKSFIFFFYSGK